MKWIHLLSKERSVLYNDTNGYNNVKPNDTVRAPYLIDVDRLIYSKFFRKLQDKTQVYPLSGSDYVRTRLTHSLEVSGVGRSLGFGIGEYLVKKYDLLDITSHDFGYILQAACLAHDIGNPPFGHLGEDAIVNFFKERKDELLNHISKEEYYNLLNFDGNAQGFRIITNLAGWNGDGGLRLTYATLGAFCKYPHKIVLHDDDIVNIDYLGAKKYGVFKTEHHIFDNMIASLALEAITYQGHTLTNAYFRHPLAFLVEAADDICYCVADIEDAFLVNIITLQDVEELLAPIARSAEKYAENTKERIKNLRKEAFYKDMSSVRKVEWMRGKAISNLVGAVQQVFISNEEQILNGDLNADLLSLTPYHQDILRCRQFALKKIFVSHIKLNAEIKGLNAISVVLNEFYNIIIKPAHPKSLRINNLFNNIIDVHKYSFYENLVRTIDLVADFTDHKLLEIAEIIKS